MRLRRFTFLIAFIPFAAGAQDVMKADASGKCPTGYFMFVANICVSKEAMDRRGTDYIVSEVERLLPGTSSSKSNRRSSDSSSTTEATIDGEFTGWEGETIIKLTNGQIWQQAEYYYYYHYAYNPRVLIFASGGGQKMQIDGTQVAVRVNRLK